MVDINAVLYHNGAIAQLGERLPCTQEVSGSIPLSSTNPSSPVFVFFSVIGLKNSQARGSGLSLASGFFSRAFFKNTVECDKRKRS